MNHLAPGKKFFVSQVMARKYHARVRPPAPKAEKDIKQASDDEPDEGIDEELKETLRQKKRLIRELAARRGWASRSARLAQESASRLGDFKAKVPGKKLCKYQFLFPRSWLVSIMQG